MTDDAFGVRVALHDRCFNCGCCTAFVGHGPAPLYRQLLCEGCECGRGYVSKELRSFLEKFVRQFGRPTEPIVLCTGKVHKPEPRAVAAETALKRKNTGKSKMKMSELFPSKYLRAADLQGKSRVVMIEKVSHEDFKDDGVAVRKTVIHLRGSGTAPVVVNKVNWRMLVAITGSDDDDNWPGTTIQLRSEKVAAPGGRIVDSIRVHEAPQPTKATATGAKLNDDIGF
jgi:hypothetical protein